jgi:predicted nuclease of predicted toxin-antitoxin system
VKFLVDNQLPAALARHLRESGADCHHMAEAKFESATDSEIWAYMTESGRVLITKGRSLFSSHGQFDGQAADRLGSIGELSQRSTTGSV